MILERQDARTATSELDTPADRAMIALQYVTALIAAVAALLLANVH
jgi:hypothetical protein